MVRRQSVTRTLVLASMILATACDTADSLSAPRLATDSVKSLATPDDGEPSATALVGPMLTALATDLCADVYAVSQAAGAEVVTWTCHGGANQKFTLTPSGEITVYDGAMCLDAWTGQGNNGDKIVIWPCHGGANQKWRVTAAGEIRGINNKCLDVWAASRQRGTRLVLWDCHGGANQKWSVPSAAARPAYPAAPTDSTRPLGGADSAGTPGAPVPSGSAELPRTYLSTAMPAATGRTIAVAAGGNLQAALDAAQPGDVVSLAPGASFVGNFYLPAKAGMTAGQWIVVRTAGALPPEGTRVGPGDAARMAKIVTPNGMAAVHTTPGTQGWRFTGVEVTAANSVTSLGALVSFGTAGGDQMTAAQVPSRLVLDRSYVHGHPSLHLRRCVLLNSAATAVVDSYLSECHGNQGDSQAILGYNGPGPFKIANNYLEGGHEVVMFGGGDPTVPNLVPGDIELRRNHVTRPTGWRGVWQAKNLLELKNARRVLAEGNVFENHWEDAQSGFAFMWFSVNQEGRCSWCVVEDVTFRHNRVRNVDQGFNIARYQGPSAQPARRVTIANNVITGVRGRMFQVNGDVVGLTIVQNTAIAGHADLSFVSTDQPIPSLVFQNNITGGYYTLFTSAGEGPRAMAALRIPAGNVAGNVFQANWDGNVPAGNAFARRDQPAGTVIGFVNYDGGDLRLSLLSPFARRGVNGSTPGADAAAVASMTQGVVR